MHVVGYRDGLAPIPGDMTWRLAPFSRRISADTTASLFVRPRPRVAEFNSFQATSHEVRSVLAREPVSSVVFDACSQAGLVHELCETAEGMAQGASASESAWHLKHVKRKTDRDDALKLAGLAAVGEIDSVSSVNC